MQSAPFLGSDGLPASAGPQEKSLHRAVGGEQKGRQGLRGSRALCFCPTTVRRYKTMLQGQHPRDTGQVCADSGAPGWAVGCNPHHRGPSLSRRQQRLSLFDQDSWRSGVIFCYISQIFLCFL